jgi:hypothetical protein
VINSILLRLIDKVGNRIQKLKAGRQEAKHRTLNTEDSRQWAEENRKGQSRK